MKNRIRKGDIVEVLSGRDKGRRGRVLEVMPKEGRALVEHINMVHKHRRQRSQRDQGGIINVEQPLALCKLMLVSDDTPTRVRYERDDEGRKQRIAVRTGRPV